METLNLDYMWIGESGYGLSQSGSITTVLRTDDDVKHNNYQLRSSWTALKQLPQKISTSSTLFQTFV